MTAPTDNGEFPGSTPRPWGPSGTNMIVSPTREEVRQRMAEGNFPITSKRICSTENPTYMTPEEETANRDLILSAVNNHDHLTAEVRRLQNTLDGTNEGVNDLANLRDRAEEALNSLAHFCGEGHVEHGEWDFKKSATEILGEWQKDREEIRRLRGETISSSGEHVVFGVLSRDFIDHGEHYLIGDQVWWHKGERCPSPGVKILCRISDPAPALRQQLGSAQAEVRRLTDEVAAYRNAANYWYMVCKQDRGESVPRWSTDESDDRAMHEAAKDRQALVDERDRLKVAAEAAKEAIQKLTSIALFTNSFKASSDIRVIAESALHKLTAPLRVP